MKYNKLLKIAALALFAISASCNKTDHDHDHDKNEEHHGHDHDEKGDHSSHDHDGHDDPEHDHSKCGVLVGPNGGRMIEDTAELNLTPEGKITLAFIKAPAAGTEVTLLLNGSDILELTQAGNTYTSSTNVTKFPAKLHVKIKNDDDIHVETVPLKQGKCAECKNSELACTCHNHDHDKEGHDDHHEDHDGHEDHGDHDHH